jgi:hypothetical protein
MKKIILLFISCLFAGITFGQHINIHYVKLPNGEYRAMHGNDSITIDPEYARRADFETEIATYLSSADIMSSADYYLSNAGDDNYAGTYSAPWRTLEKLQYEIDEDNIADGSIIAFRSGDEFVGNINLGTKTGITLTKYGIGAKPIITGMQTLIGWAQHSANIYKTAVNRIVTTPLDVSYTSSTIKYLTINDQQYLKGRYPSASTLFWFPTTGGNASYFIDATNLTQADDYWNGTEVVFRINDYWFQVRTVTNFTALTDRVDLSAAASEAFGTTHGYFFQNSLKCLLDNGDWYYSGDSIYLYSTVNPNTLDIQTSVYDHGISTQNATGITISNLNITGYNLSGIYDYSTDNLTVLNNDISYCLRGIFLYEYASGFSIKNNKFHDIGSIGIHAVNVLLGTVENNSMTDIGMNPGYENLLQELPEGLMGMYFAASDSVLIYRNDINSVGYNGIDMTGCDKFHIEKNRIKNYCQVVDDGAGIYAYECNGIQAGYHGNYWKNNFVEAGDKVGSNFSKYLAYPRLLCYGLYLDDNCTHFTLENNLSVNNGHSNILLHGVAGCTIRNNWTTKANGDNNWNEPAEIYFVASDTAFANNRIVSNKFVMNHTAEASTNTSYTGYLASEATFNNTNVFDSNYYFLATGNFILTDEIFTTNITSYDLAAWIATVWGSANEKGDELVWTNALTNTTQKEFVTYDYNFSEVPKLYYMETGWTYYEPTTGAEVTSLVLAPYTGHVLYRINDLDI